MPSQLAQAVTRAAYGARQLPRVAWYIGHSLVLRELADTVRQSEKSKARRRVYTNAPVPDRNHIYSDMAKLFLQDLANVEAGIYPLPVDHDGSPICLNPSTVQSPFELSFGGAGAMLRGSDTERATLSQGSHANWTA